MAEIKIEKKKLFRNNKAGSTSDMISAMKKMKTGESFVCPCARQYASMICCVANGWIGERAFGVRQSGKEVNIVRW